MKINIDNNSGFCWGVVRTIDIAEKSLEEAKDGNIFVLGQIIHNPKEAERLENIGLKSITHKDFERLAHKGAKVIIRAHGEPPETYQKAKELGIEIIDATCPLVTALQKRIQKHYLDGWQIVVFGKEDHAEVIGLKGVCNGNVIVIQSVEQALEKIDFNKRTILFSQTTMDKPTFHKIKEAIEERVTELIDEGELKEQFLAKDTICHFVYGREDNLREFCKQNDVVIFVAGRSSSNGKSLYHVCQSVNDKVYFIEDHSEIDFDWLKNANSVGITGATSTPQWYMELVRDKILEKITN
ncbi:4-hydroxy-3-methylbut-2-enyl diphosphate reductase [Bacteroidetes/Chlorobi group bacterium ChocPot_Mid]|jgi:4-hydroxy-3-methylbut-2-enyl diphosphate reductase|nr:MAG: 4-hydroxy-3-methylbut-2-enyl diphosphate reductase [Bacteroidetes/Chlorobi group bacterium ChocPot_Mid]